ncbi:hypothetical protein ACFLXB_09190 [Chloroflexota bacterium]
MIAIDSILRNNLEAGTGIPIFIMGLHYWNGSAWSEIETYEVIQATLMRLKFDVYVPGNVLEEVDQIVNSNWAIDIERGLTVAGEDYTVTTNYYYIVDITYSEQLNQTHILAELLPSMSINNVSMAQPLRDIFDDGFDQINSASIDWDEYRDIWYDWVPPEDEGEEISLQDARQMINLCHTRLFSYIFPRNNKKIYIYGVASNHNNNMDGYMYPFDHAQVTQFLWPDKPINLSWQSESGTQTYEPDGQTAHYVSIGSIADADDPSANSQFQEWGRVFNEVCYQYVQRPNIGMEQGDLVSVPQDGNTKVRCMEQIEFFKRGGNPQWVQVIRQLPYHPHIAYIEDWIDWFYSTPYSFPSSAPGSSSGSAGSAGTAVATPSLSADARYISVNSGLFTNALGLNDLDVQTALNTLDKALVSDHGNLDGLSDDDHTQYIKHALATAVNDFLVASGSGAFVKKTLAEVKTLLSLPEDHGALSGLSDDDHTQYIKHALATAVNDFLVSSGSGAFVKKTLAEVQALIGVISDHGALSGLSDDDHTQYLKIAGDTMTGALKVNVSSDALLVGGTSAINVYGTAKIQTLGGDDPRIDIIADSNISATSPGLGLYKSNGSTFVGGYFYYQPYNITSFYGPNASAAIFINSTRQVGVGAATQPTATMHLKAVYNYVQFKVQGHSSQTYDLQQWLNSGGTVLSKVNNAGNLFLAVKSGATQAAAGAAAGEVWKTASHASLPDNVLMIGV